MNELPPRIGVDLIEISRMTTLDSTPGLAEQLFTPGEIARARARRDTTRFLASCFAAKEAFLKASGLGLHTGLRFSEIEIEYTPPDRPTLTLLGSLKERFAETFHCHLSMGHSRDMACAVVALEEKRKN